MIEPAKKKKKASNLALKPLLEFLKSNPKIKWPRSSANEDNLQCLFRTWLGLSDLSTDREPKARNRNIASFGVNVLTSLFSSKVSTHHLLRLFYVCLFLKRKNCCPWKISALFSHTIYSDGDRLWLLTGVTLSPLINTWPTLTKRFAQWASTES